MDWSTYVGDGAAESGLWPRILCTEKAIHSGKKIGRTVLKSSAEAQA